VRVIEKHIVPAEADSERIEGFIHSTFQLLPTRNSAKKAVKRKCIQVNGKFIESGTRIKEGEFVELIQHEVVKPEFSFPIKIVHEDEWIAVVEKPPGLRVNGNYFKTVENALIGKIKKSDKNDALEYCKVVHRLDIPTGGLLLVAKTGNALIDCSKQFEKRLVRKKYRAVVIGKPDSTGEFNSSVDGREAVTRYRIIKTVPSLRNKWLTLVEIHPETGRRHQIRKHFSEEGFPILGDKDYGIDGLVLKGKGLFLWSTGLTFVHPGTQKSLTFEISEPAKFTRLLEREERRWKRYQ
jgi:23S rRNA pseudouridine1911/1915/1917 synthase